MNYRREEYRIRKDKDGSYFLQKKRGLGWDTILTQWYGEPVTRTFHTEELAEKWARNEANVEMNKWNAAKVNSRYVKYLGKLP